MSDVKGEVDDLVQLEIIPRREAGRAEAILRARRRLGSVSFEPSPDDLGACARAVQRAASALGETVDDYKKLVADLAPLRDVDRYREALAGLERHLGSAREAEDRLRSIAEEVARETHRATEAVAALVASVRQLKEIAA